DHSRRSRASGQSQGGRPRARPLERQPRAANRRASGPRLDTRSRNESAARPGSSEWNRLAPRRAGGARRVRGGAAAPRGRWGGAEMVIVLRFAVVGAPPEHWFSQPDLLDPELAARYRWSWRGLRWGSRLAGMPLPLPRHVPLDRPDAIVRWMSDTLRAGAVP